MRIAAIEVSHWHSLYDAAYLRILASLPDVELVGLHDPSLEIASRRASALGDPPVFTDYREMLTKTRPDFVVALGQHARMARTAHDLLDHGVPFLMEKPMGLGAAEVEGIADRAAATRAFVAPSVIGQSLPSTPIGPGQRPSSFPLAAANSSPVSAHRACSSASRSRSSVTW